MSHVTRVFVSFALILTASAATAQEPAHVPGEVIAKMREGGDLARIDEALARDGCVRVEMIDDMGLMLIAFDPGIPVADIVALLESHPDIEYAHPNYVGGGGGFTPDDTWFGSQWHHDNVGQSGGTVGADLESIAAWDMTRGSAGVLVAVLDTGIDSDHPDFAGRLVPGFDFVNGDADPEADHPHGVQVTGLAAANGNNAFSVAGVDHFCSIEPVKVLDQNNNGTTFDLIQGINFAAGADILSMSLINYPNTPGLQTALQTARNAGSILIACAGNGGIGNADVSFPGASPLTISIGATDDDDVRPGYSGTGTALDLVAPGDLVGTVVWNNNDSISIFNGCSAATPVAAGVASLALSVDPTLTHAQMLQLLIDGAEDEVGDPAEDTPGRDDFHGFGRINARLTLCELDEAAPTINCPPDSSAECSETGGTPASDPAIAAFLGGVTASDDLDGNHELANDAPGFFAVGATPVTFTASDECEKDSDCSATLTVQDTTPPQITCPADLVIECNAQGGVSALDPAVQAFLAGASSDDVCDPAVSLGDDAPGFFSLGSTDVTFTATDDAGKVAECVATVDVADTTPPTISMSLDPDRLWPPSHELKEITATVDVEDVCDPVPGFVLTSVASDEPDNGKGDGNTTNDIQGAAFGTPDVTLHLRSERSGRGSGRIYTVVYTASDGSGNTADATATVTVPHDRR